DDNAETLLFRLARGTGLKGAGGIPAVRGKIIRPLIELSSAEIREYCNSNNIIYRTDSTNKCNNYTRNYIRNEILPKFKEINPGFETAFSCFMSDANDDIDFIEKCADEAYERSFCDNKLRKDMLAKYDSAVSKRVVLKYFSNYNISLDRLHLNEIMKLTEKTGKIQICSNYFAASDKDYLRLAVFGTKTNDCSFVSEILKISEFDSKGVDFYCDYDKIIGQVKIRRREAGDIISPANRGCSKSLKKLYNELKIPQEMRSSVGVMADEQGVIGVIGYCVDERVKVDRSTKKILSVKTSFGGLVNE
ncbi:MAG: tRNA lysidine(34) synthetase TilS, partial [Eubacterium sp.]